MFFLSFSNVWAAPSSENSLIQKYAAAIQHQNWGALVELESSENKEGLKRFIDDPESKNTASGIFAIQAAKVKEWKEIPTDVASRFTSLQYYQEKYQDVHAFLVGFDFRVKNESKYFFDGVNYRLFITGKENGTDKILEVSDAPIESLIPLGYGFQSDDEKAALDIVNKRLKGQIVNKQGKLLPDENFNKINTSAKDEVKILSAADHIVPSIIRVYMIGVPSTNPLNGKVLQVDFSGYVKDVLPNEWYTSWSSESLKAGAMAVKMYGWYHVFHPKWPGVNADVSDTVTSQVYVIGSAVSSTSSAVDAVNHVAVQDSAGNLFEPQYRAGTPNDRDLYEGTGIMSQWGTQAWAQTPNAKTYLQMCHYYWDTSSSSQISTFSY